MMSGVSTSWRSRVFGRTAFAAADSFGGVGVGTAIVVDNLFETTGVIETVWLTGGGTGVVGWRDRGGGTGGDE